MGTKAWILQFLKKNGEIRTPDIVKERHISRQTAAEHLRQLADKKLVIKMGSTIDSHYVLYRSKLAASQKNTSFSKSFLTQRLQEDKVFSQITEELKLKKRLSERALQITSYAFTEMLNNAIDHSGARKVTCTLALERGKIKFLITDRGKGAFETIRKKFQIKDHYEAIECLLKGKQTTAPKHHSGQGIFFTSKIADHFLLKNAKLALLVANETGDLTVEELSRFVRGTEVSFDIKLKSQKSLKALFDEYSNENFEFDKTQIAVKLSPKEAWYVSRSEAKRLLNGLEKFQRIVFDFKGVSTIGQAFADEIFRVFAESHPGITIEPIHMSQPVEFMIKRAVAELTNSSKDQDL